MVKNKINKMPRRTSTREAAGRDKDINVMAILADKHPQNVDDYAIHLYYRHTRSPFFRVDDKRILDNESAEIIVDSKKLVKVNIRTGVIQETPLDEALVS
jgi:hypothetical protein